ncbi:MAG: hypothetical protein AB8B87_13860 [Granulosicoccus sp.]
MLKAIAAGTLSLCVLLISCFHYFNLERKNAISSSSVRQSMVQRQHAEQRLSRLNDGAVNPLLSVLGEDVSALQIRIAEFLSPSGVESTTNQLMYDQSLLAESLPTDTLLTIADTPIEEIRILRLDLQAQFSNEQEFLAMLDAIRVEIGGWPVEVRACDLGRMPMPSIKARCVLDIYHWTVIANDANG